MSDYQKEQEAGSLESARAEAAKRQEEKRRAEEERRKRRAEKKRAPEKERISEQELGSLESARAALAGSQSGTSLTLVKQRIEEAREAIKQAESYKQAVGSTVTWGEQTYNLGTTQGWKDYQQAVREAKSEVRTAERQVKQYEFQEISRQAPTSRAPTFSPITEVGPPKIATPSDVARLRAEGYDLPEGKTIYISPSGQPYYYKGEIEQPEKSLSMQLWEESEQIDPSEVARYFGVPYSPKGARQIGAVLTGSLEQTLTPILRIIPGEQPFELMEGEVGFSWRDVEGTDQLTKAEEAIAKIAGFSAEVGINVVATAAVFGAGSAVIGASGAAVSRIPTIGSILEKGGAFLSNTLNTPIGKVVLVAPIVAIEGKKAYELKEAGRTGTDIVAELMLDASKLYGAAIGTSRGLSYGKTIPARVERLLKGGVTISEEAFIPKYVLEGENFPKFSEEPYPPTAKGYEEMAKAYTPEELRIADEAIPSYHATPGSLEGKTPEGFITQMGKRPGEGGMFFAPAGSKHFLRIESGYSLEPGLPNIFGEPKWIYGEFPGVVETGLSKSSLELAKILEESAGTGKLFMPAEQMGEAQAILGPGTEMATVKEGRFWADMGGKIVKIERVIPKTLAETLKLDTVKVESLESLLSKQAATESYLYGPQKTTYLPILSSHDLLKKADSSLKKVSAPKTSSSQLSRVSTIESSLKKADSSLKVGSKTTSYTLEPSSLTVSSKITSLISTRKTPSYPSPSYPEPTYPSLSYPEPSYPPSTPPSYPPSTPPRTPPSYPPLIRGESLILTTGKGKKKKKGVFELRVAFREPRLPKIRDIETKMFKEPKLPGFETGGKKKGKKKKGLKIF